MIPRDWVGEPVVVIASGPSLCQEDVDYCRGKARVIVVNDCWRMAPWADALYASDLVWWDHHSGVPEFAGEKWTNRVGADAGFKYGAKVVEITSERGFSQDPAKINRLGGNGGGQAANIGLLRGGSPVLLLGFDMQPTGGRKHWFGDHPGRLNRTQNFTAWQQAMDEAAKTLPANVSLINCSRQTALKAYPRASIADCLPAYQRQAALSA